MTVLITVAAIAGIPEVLLVLAGLGLLIALSGLTGMVLRRPAPAPAEPRPPRVMA